MDALMGAFKIILLHNPRDYETAVLPVATTKARRMHVRIFAPMQMRRQLLH